MSSRAWMGMGAVSALLLAGCTAVMVEDKDGGLAQEYPLSAEDGLKVSRRVLDVELCSVSTDAKAPHFLRGTISSGAFTSGGTIGVWVDSLGPERCSVTALARRSVPTQIWLGFSESDFHQRFQEVLEAYQKGVPLEQITAQ